MGGRALVRAGAAVAFVTTTTACGSDFVAPTTRDECYGAGREQRGGNSADASSVWTMTYSEDKHPLGSSATIYLCVPGDSGATVESVVDPAEGVVVEPDTLVLTAGSGEGVPTLRVTVTEGGEHRLQVTYDSGGGGGTGSVHIDVDGDEWSFRER